MMWHEQRLRSVCAGAFVHGTGERCRRFVSCFALISAIELDLQDFIILELLTYRPLSKIASNATFEKVEGRAKRDRALFEGNPSDNDLLTYIDFGDAIEIISANQTDLSTDARSDFKTFQPIILKLIQIRNRVMHSRPLLAGDFPTVIDASGDLIKSPRRFVKLSDALVRLKQTPEHVLSLDIPDAKESEKISHNLPIPDFDETGFIGRKEQSDLIRKHIYGAYPVITIIGIGGIGKTALALKTAYDIVDDPNCPFEAVVWTSSKTTTLGRSEILRIESAITTSLGVLQSINETLGGTNDADFSEIIEYMQTFKILLIIDNLETVLDPKIRHFLSQVPMGSKVLITSRVGLGGYDFPYLLPPFESKDSVKLIRELSAVRSLEILQKARPEILHGYAERMKNNPGFIKWFVTAVNAGERPEKLLSEPKLFLEFCMQNVFEHLSTNARLILDTIIASGTSHSFSMLHYLTELDPIDLEKAMLDLVSSNMVTMQNSEDTVVYRIAEIPNMYLRNFHKPRKEVVLKIQNLRRQIVSLTEDIESAQKTHPFNMNTVAITDKAYRVVAKYLHEALKAMKLENHKMASEWIAKARNIEPNYFEIHRVSAMLSAHQNDLIAATESYLLAIELKPDSAPLRLWYGGFLMRYCDNHEEAITQFKIGKSLDKGTGNVFNLNIARAHVYLRQFDHAEEIIESLEKNPGLEERSRLILISLKLQFFVRKAEYQSDHKEFIDAIKLYKSLISYFEDLPLIYRDNKNIRQISTALSSLSKTVNILYHGDKPPTEILDLLKQFENVELKCNVEKALLMDGVKIGKIVTKQEKYAFIQDESGEKHFFHKGSMINQEEFESLIPKHTYVYFRVGMNKQGPCAIDVSIGIENLAAAK